MENVVREGFFSIDLNVGDSVSSRADCSSLSIQTINNLEKKATAKISASLGLVFINQNEATGEVCFANEPGLRPEFRQSFTTTDLLNYIYAVLQTHAEQSGGFLKTGVAEIPYPTNADDFWKMVQTGSGLR